MLNDILFDKKEINIIQLGEFHMKNTLNKIYKYKMQMKQLNAPRKN